MVADGGDGAVVLCGVAAADAEYFIVECRGDAVACGCGVSSGQFPWCAVHQQGRVFGSLSQSQAAGYGKWQCIDAIGPCFGAAIPGFFVGEICAPDHEQVIV